MVIIYKKFIALLLELIALKKYTTEFFKEKVKTLAREEYEVIGEYISSQTKIKMKHNKCGCEYEVIPNSFIMGIRCPHCYKSIPYDTNSFKKKIYDVVGDAYSLIGEYKNSNTKIKLKHKICGYEYEVRPNDFLNGRRCPNCNKQKSVKIILKSNLRLIY